MESIGARLKKARESKGISIEQACAATKIQKNTLIALEDDQADKSLSPFYIKNFLKSYAQYLGLDNASFIKEYLLDKSTQVSPPTLQVKKEPFPLVYKNGLIFLISAIAVIAFIALCSFVLKSGCIKKKGKATITKQPAAGVVKKKDISFSETHKISIPKDTPLKLSATAKKNTWVTIKSDGKVIFQNVLTAGQTEEWTAKEMIEMWLGDAGGVFVTLNGYKLGFPGKQGQAIKDIVFTRQGMKIGGK